MRLKSKCLLNIDCQVSASNIPATEVGEHSVFSHSNNWCHFKGNFAKALERGVETHMGTPSMTVTEAVPELKLSVDRE